MEGNYKLCKQLFNGDFITNLLSLKLKNPNYVCELGKYLIEEIEDYCYYDRIISDKQIIDIFYDIYDEWGLQYLSYSGYNVMVELLICNIYDLTNDYNDLNRLDSISYELLSSLNSKLSIELTLEQICDPNNEDAHRLVLDYCSSKTFIYMLTESEEVTEYYNQQYYLK